MSGLPTNQELAAAAILGCGHTSPGATFTTPKNRRQLTGIVDRRQVTYVIPWPAAISSRRGCRKNRRCASLDENAVQLKRGHSIPVKLSAMESGECYCRSWQL